MTKRVGEGPRDFFGCERLLYNDKATLQLTIPRSLFKLSAKDLSLEILEFDEVSALEVFLPLGTLGHRRGELSILVRLRLSRGNHRCVLARILT